MSRECFWRDSKQSKIDIAQFSRNARNKNKTKPSIRHPSTIPHYTLVSQTLFQKSATFKFKTTWVHWKKVWQGTLPLLEFIFLREPKLLGDNFFWKTPQHLLFSNPLTYSFAWVILIEWSLIKQLVFVLEIEFQETL